MPTILVVDDSETMRDQLKSDLVAAGYDVIEGENGEDGLEKACHNDLGLVITDLNMPKMDGMNMCSHIQQKSEGKAMVPVFILTTQTNAELKARAKEVGVKAWILKPYNHTNLIKAVNKICPL